MFANTHAVVALFKRDIGAWPSEMFSAREGTQANASLIGNEEVILAEGTPEYGDERSTGGRVGIS
jgi:hypothetical protein